MPTGTYPTSYGYYCANDTTSGETVTIGTPDTSNPRIDYIVAYVDLSVTPSNTTPNNPNNMFVLADVQGTPAASPVVPTTSQIQSAIGAANPYIILAEVAVGTSVTQITNGNITDLRSFASVAPSGGYVPVYQQTTGDAAIIQAAGTDTNIALQLEGKGTGGVEIATPYEFSIYASVIPSSYFTSSSEIVPFNTATFDPKGAFDATTHSYTIPVTGKWQINSHLVINNGPNAGALLTLLQKNGAPGTGVSIDQDKIACTASQSYTSLRTANTYMLAAGDIITLYGNSTGTWGSPGGILGATLSGYLVSIT